MCLNKFYGSNKQKHFDPQDLNMFIHILKKAEPKTEPKGHNF